MNANEQIKEMAKDIGEKQRGGWKFVGESEGTTDVFNEELAEHLISKDYRKSTEVAREIFADIEEYAIHEVISSGDCLITMSVARFAELKKKYIDEDEI